MFPVVVEQIYGTSAELGGPFVSRLMTSKCTGFVNSHCLNFCLASREPIPEAGDANTYNGSHGSMQSLVTAGNWNFIRRSTYPLLPPPRRITFGI